jgi:hypothetical protein
MCVRFLRTIVSLVQAHGAVAMVTVHTDHTPEIVASRALAACDTVLRCVPFRGGTAAAPGGTWKIYRFFFGLLRHIFNHLTMFFFFFFFCLFFLGPVLLSALVGGLPLLSTIPSLSINTKTAILSHY